ASVGGRVRSFLSSRRRHTRSKRDWSSDVCSSDLVRLWVRRPELAWANSGRRTHRRTSLPASAKTFASVVPHEPAPITATCAIHRSEERRVGKACYSPRSRGRRQE